MKLQKRWHWKNFLEDPNNIWKAHSYTKRAQGFIWIPTLPHDQKTYDSDEDKAKLFMHTFPPPQPARITPETVLLSSTQLPWSLLTRKEVKSAFFSQKPDKALRVDTIPFRVWHQLWPVVEEHIFQLYSFSLELAFLPSSWRVAKIIAMAKPNKKDCTIPKVYRLISFITTISKGLETVIASWMSYLAETHNLLPENHFGACKRRSCEQAVNVVIEKIYDAWREVNVLTFITFDVQETYNGVKADLLAERLRQR